MNGTDLEHYTCKTSKEHKWIIVSRKDWTEEELIKVNSEVKDGTFIYGD